MSKHEVSVDCPNCGERTFVEIEVKHGKCFFRGVALCYPEEGGCDQWFAYELKMNFETSTSEVEF